MSVLKLKPCCKDYIWGGRRLAEEYGIASDKDILAEAWVLSCHPDGPSVIVNGPDQGKTLAQYIQETGAQALGTHCRRFRDFPILVKFIDAKQNLSVQVHPGNRYALAEEHQYGKTEMWYVMDAGPNAFLYYGFKREVSRRTSHDGFRRTPCWRYSTPSPSKRGMCCSLRRAPSTPSAPAS